MARAIIINPAPNGQPPIDGCDEVVALSRGGAARSPGGAATWNVG